MIKYKYCPKCASKVLNKKTFYSCTSCGYKVFPHSAITASVLPIHNGKVLLARRAIEPQKGKVDVLGGFLNYGEDPKKAAIREVKEETGRNIKILDLIGIYTDSYFYQNENVATLNFVYVVKLKNGQTHTADDISDVFWQPISKLPKGIAFKTVKEALKDLKKWHKENSGRGGQN